MAQRKPYNPNTVYGRRKLREQAQQSYENMTPSEKSEVDAWKWGCLLIVIVAVILYAILTGDWNGALKWLSR
jgi:hypothetical protein